MLAFVPAAISELLKRFPSTEGFLWVKQKRHEHILKILHFLSLRYSADFGRSRLVLYTAKFAYANFLPCTKSGGITKVHCSLKDHLIFLMVFNIHAEEG